MAKGQIVKITPVLSVRFVHLSNQKSTNSFVSFQDYKLYLVCYSHVQFADTLSINYHYWRTFSQPFGSTAGTFHIPSDQWFHISLLNTKNVDKHVQLTNYWSQISHISFYSLLIKKEFVWIWETFIRYQVHIIHTGMIFTIWPLSWLLHNAHIPGHILR